MKNLILLLFLITILFSCTNESEEYLFIEDCNYSEDGQIHNSFQENFLSEVLYWGERGALNTCEDGIILLDSFFHDFVETENYPQETIDYIDDQFKTSKFIFWDPDISKIDSFLISNGIDQSILHHLHLVEQFEYNYQNETINEYFIRLDNYIASFPTDISQNLFFAQSVDIGKSSLCYWDRNLQSWVEEIDLAISSRGKERPDGWLGDTLHGMFESDFWSGVTVGLATLTPHGAVAGACYGSAARGIKELFD